MKNIRLIAAILLILTGILHLLPLVTETKEPNSLPMLVFGVIYSVTGVLLLLDKKIAPILGVIFPLIGLALGFLVVGLNNWTSMLSGMFLIDLFVVFCCLLLLFNRNKATLEIE